MNISKKNLALIIVGTLALGILVGWLIKRTTIEERITIRYVEQEPTTIVVEKPIPIESKPIEIPIHHYDTIKVREEIHIIPDTLAIIADYLQRREYNLDFSTDTTGIFKVNAIVEANHLASATATVAPLQKVVERVVKEQPRKFRPYLGGGLEVGIKANKTVGVSVEVGALIKNKHLPRVGYMRLGNNNHITFNYGYVF